MQKITVEICCGSAADVYEAKNADADRVELNSSMFLGGITPSIGELRVARKAGLPVMAMVRPREGGFCYTNHEFETMISDAEAFVKEGVEGLVFGILNADGSVDTERCRRMLDVIGDRQRVFHRALDVVPDWRAAIDTLIELGFTRVLTSGQAPSVHYGIETVRDMIEYADGRIEVLPGAGINRHNVVEIIEKTGCAQIHFALSKIYRDSSTDANSDIFFGGALYPPEDRYSVVDREGVREMIGLVGG